MRYVIFIFILFCGCSPNSLEDFQQEGESIIRKLTLDLETIHTREDLNKSLPKLKKKFDCIVDLLIEAKAYKEAHPDEMSMELGEDNFYLNVDLMNELKRIYRLEGGKEIIEKTQRESLIRLDAFEKKLQKERQVLPKKS